MMKYACERCDKTVIEFSSEFIGWERFNSVSYGTFYLCPDCTRLLIKYLLEKRSEING